MLKPNGGGKIGKVTRLGLWVMVASLLSVTFSVPKIAIAQYASCEDKQSLDGFDVAKTSIEIKSGDLIFSITTKKGEKCIIPQIFFEQSGIKVDAFYDPRSLFINAKDSTFTAYRWLQGRWGDKPILIYFIVSEDKDTSKGAQYQGLYFKFTGQEDTSHDTTKYYNSTRGDGTGFLAGTVVISTFKNKEGAAALYKELFNLRGKTVKNAVVDKSKITLNLDLSINYSGSEVGSRKPPYQPKDEPGWTGKQAQLPGLSEKTVSVQLWKKPVGGSSYKYYRSYKKELASNPSDGKVTFQDEVGEGDYTMTSFMQISFDGDARFQNIITFPYSLIPALTAEDSYDAKMLTMSNNEQTLLDSGTDLDTVIGTAKDTVFYQEYLGLINRGRTDLFIAQNKFTVTGTSQKTLSLAPVYTFGGSTRDIYKELLEQIFPECSIGALFVSNSNIGQLFGKMTTCLINTILVPAVKWAAQLVEKAAGIVYRQPEPWDRWRA